MTNTYKSNNKAVRGPARPTLVEWPPVEAEPAPQEPEKREQPQPLTLDDFGRYGWIDPAFEQPGLWCRAAVIDDSALLRDMAVARQDADLALGGRINRRYGF